MEGAEAGESGRHCAGPIATEKIQQGKNVENAGCVERHELIGFWKEEE